MPNTARKPVPLRTVEAMVYDASQPGYNPQAYMKDSVIPTPTSASQLLSGFPQADTPRGGYSNVALESPTLSAGQSLKLPRKNPFAEGFEAPHRKTILFHIVLCVVTYPILLLVTIIARERSLFWTRFIVGLGCGILGLIIGLSLLKLAQPLLEAVTWATVIHQSRAHENPGVRLRDLAATARDPTSPLTGLKLLWDRAMYPGTSRSAREHYDRRWWSIYVAFFLLLVAIAGSLSFVLGRLVDITTAVIHQRESYQEVYVMGASSEEDLARASGLRTTFDNYILTWTLSPSSTHGGLPPVVSFNWQNDTVHFAEIITSQLLADGSGFGTFDTESKNASTSEPNMNEMTTMDKAKQVIPGAILSVTLSANGLTYMFTPHATLETLFSSFDMVYPRSQMIPFDPTKTLKANDTLPLGWNPDDIALGVTFYNNGVGHSFFSRQVPTGEDFNGWVTIEQVLVRLNTTYTPEGRFARLSDSNLPDQFGNPTWYGYDAAVCVQLFEPWVLEVYNSTTGLPASLRIVEQGSIVRSAQVDYEKLFGTPMVDNDVSKELNSSKLEDVYVVAHENSIHQIIKDNGRDSFYVPSPTVRETGVPSLMPSLNVAPPQVVSFTDGKGALGYTQLSAERFAQVRGLADASNILPYFSGSGKILARRYDDLALSSASINPLPTGIYLGFILIIGLLAGFFVPKLPMDVPRRGFELYTWMAAFHADELVGEGRSTGIARNMELDEIAERLGDLKFRYVNPQHGAPEA
ncbi:hypothetical protein H0H81_006415 [Sphagnurus paluster]|uniref:Uncharacterized protein n=1 Tax=Sphagnurus paluster TaxID=117069 RepID=A0A9P7FXR1_9AGAR|nr:hypothetical protein H0H81_006415 [Sphagnurus paluster]